MTGPRDLLRESLATIERLEGRLREAERAAHMPLAIVGAGCRFPGEVEDLEGLWRLVRDRVDAVSEVPADRWNRDAYYDPDRAVPGKMSTKRGGFLSRVDLFEPQIFGISPREAASMDPQQRLLLEASWEALENAAIPTDSLNGTATGVFVGITASDYGTMLQARGPEQADVYSATGSTLNAAAGRIAFTFGFQGPCVAVDTACSSSLVAVHLACQSLRAGESDLALAGGVNVILSPHAMILFSKWGMMAPDGACKTFDAAADGFVRAEGCGVLAIKRLADAIAAKDPILAVIRGTAVNSDGRSSGLTVPNGPAQRVLLQKALASARLEPSDIDYVEAHGTGTSLGDPIEVEALGAVLRKGRAPEKPLLIGSIKTNLGHTESASGVAGLLKVAASLRHEAIPAHLHFKTPNPGIPWSDLPIAVPTELVPWKRASRPRRAGVSAFGVSGTNAHVILEEAPVAARDAAREAQAERGPVVVPLSAREDVALRAHAARVAQFAESASGATLADIALTAATGRAHLARRVAIVAESRADLARDLKAFAAGRGVPAGAEGTIRPGERVKWAFLFTGQGAQYAGMGKGLYESEPAFRKVIDRAAQLLAGRLPRPLLEVLFPVQATEGASSPLGETAYTQPALFALEYALAELWRSWGVVPSAVLGHSVGEYVAAAVAGAVSFEDGLLLVAERARLMQELPAGGGMATLFADERAVAARIAPVADRLSIAAVNGPEATVVSGDAQALADLVAACTAEGLECRPLEVSHAFHSPRLDPMLDAFERRASAVATEAPRVPLVSNLTGAFFAAGERPGGAYWRRHAREAVRFAAGVETLRAAGITGLVEVGPHPTLLALAARAAPQARWASAASLRRGRDDRREMLGALAVLYAHGASVAWDAVHRDRPGARVALPTYPFQRERHWVAEAPAASPVTRGHPLLGERRDLATAPGTHLWESALALDAHPWLRDHKVQGAAVVPASAYVELALAAGAELEQADRVAVRDVQNLKPIILREGETRALQTVLVADEGGSFRFSVHSRGSDAAWATHVTGRVGAGVQGEAPAVEPIDAIRGRCPRELEGAAFYAAFAKKGNDWGPSFQGLQHVWLGDGEALGEVRVGPALLAEGGRYRFHPAISDACAHVLVAAASLARDGAFVGGGLGEVRLTRSPAGTALWVHARLRRESDGDERVVVGDLRIGDEGGLFAETTGARIVYLDAPAEGVADPGAPADWQYEVRWKPAEATTRDAVLADGTWVLFGDRSGLAAAIAARRAAAGRKTVLADSSDARRVLEASPAPAAVLHLGSSGAGPESVVAILQAILAAPGPRRSRIWIVTEDTQPAVGADRCGSPFGAALWGIGRALSAEHAELWGGLIDLPADAPADRVAEQVVREVEARGADDQVALREGRRYVPRLERRARTAAGSELRVRPDGTVLVTGGLGGIGLAMARWLVERGARHLLLLGRTGLPTSGPRAAAVRELESLGARVEAAAADVAAEGPLEACLEARRSRGEPPVRGVIHAAGVVQLQTLATETAGGLRAALAAKVEGGWRLHRIFAKEPLDFFVLFSSSSALLRSPLLGAYAAGNAFLDGLAHHRRGLGLPALSVDWGTWGEVGMATEPGRAKGGNALTGMGAMPTARALATLGELMATDAAQVVVMAVDWSKLAAAYPGFASDPFVSSLAGGPAPPAASRSADALTALRAASGTDRPVRLVAYLQGEAARALGMKADSLDPASPLSSLGFDSLMAVQLKNQVEADLGVVVPMIRFLDGPSLNQLLPSVLEAMTDVPQGLDVAATSIDEVWEEGSI